MANPLYKPIGPIGTAQSFLLVAFPEEIPTVGVVQTNGTIVFEPISPQGQTINPVLNTNNILRLNIRGSLNEARLTSGTNELLPMINSNPLTFRLQDPSGFSNPGLTLTTPYEQPPLPGILLSGAAYTFLGSKNDTGTRGTALSITYRNYNGDQKTIITRLFPIMINYIASQGTGSNKTCSSPNTDIINTLRVLYCSWCSGSCPNFCLRTPFSTWTNLNDCSNDYNYVYCSSVGKDTYCGENGAKNCFARCRNGGNCQLSMETETLVCTTSPLQPVVPVDPLAPIEPAPGPKPIGKLVKPDVPWYKTWWFIISVIVIIVLLMVLLYAYSRSSSRTIAASQNPYSRYPMMV
jgi:hypothetical protein